MGEARGQSLGAARSELLTSLEGWHTQETQDAHIHVHTRLSPQGHRSGHYYSGEANPETSPGVITIFVGIIVVITITITITGRL